jgi:hypothetical protein
MIHDRASRHQHKLIKMLKFSNLFIPTEWLSKLQKKNMGWTMREFSPSRKWVRVHRTVTTDHCSPIRTSTYLFIHSLFRLCCIQCTVDLPTQHKFGVLYMQCFTSYFAVSHAT